MFSRPATTTWNSVTLYIAAATLSYISGGGDDSNKDGPGGGSVVVVEGAVICMMRHWRTRARAWLWLSW